MADDMMFTPDEWAPPPPEGPHDHKGYSEERCVRCGWVMGHLPLNCQNDNTPHRFPSQEAEIEWLRAENGSWRSLDQIRLDLLRQSADELRRLQAKVDAWAKAFRLWDTTRPYPDELIDAEEALLAAATKEADRG